MIRARDIVGRRIVGFRSNPQGEARSRGAPDGAHIPGDREHYHDPVIVLDDGSELRFHVEETDWGVYGVTVVRSKKG